MKKPSRHRAAEQTDPRTGGLTPVGAQRLMPPAHTTHDLAPSALDTRSSPAAPSTVQTEAPPGLWQAFGPLAPYLMREGVTDLFVTGAGELWSDGGAHGMHRVEGWTADEAATRSLAVRLIARGGRHIDEATPFVDVRLLGGIRVHAVLAPISTGGTLLSIRIPARERYRLPDLVARGSLSASDSETLSEAVAARANVLITGAGGAGNTTWRV